MKRLYQRINNVKIMKKNATSGLNVKSNNKAVLTMSTSSSCLPVIIFLKSIDNNIHLHWKFLRKVKNVISSVDYVHNVSHLNFALNYVKVFFNITALLIGYLVGFGACADRTHRTVTTVTVRLPAFTLKVFRLKLDSSKRSSYKLLFFISIKKSQCNLKFIALLYFVQISRSRSPQLSPCHNRAQITLKSKQEFTGLVNFTFFQFISLL